MYECNVITAAKLLLIPAVSAFLKDNSCTHFYSHVCPSIVTTQQYHPYIYSAPFLSLAFHRKMYDMLL